MFTQAAKMRTAEVPLTCTTCPATIDAGERYLNAVAVTNDGAARWRECETCVWSRIDALPPPKAVLAAIAAADEPVLELAAAS